MSTDSCAINYLALYETRIQTIDKLVENAVRQLVECVVIVWLNAEVTQKQYCIAGNFQGRKLLQILWI